MKKITKQLLTTLTLSSLITPQVLAFNPPSLLPSDQNTYFELNLANSPDLKQSFLSNFKTQDPPKFMLDELFNHLSFSNNSNYPYSQNFIVTSELTSDQFEQFLQNLPDQDRLSNYTKNFNQKIYIYDENNYITHYKNHLFLSSNQDLIEQIINTSEPKTLLNSPEFKSTYNLKSPQTLFYFHQAFTNQPTQTQSELAPLLNKIKSQSIIINDKQDHLEFLSTTQTQDLDLSQLQFTPKLINQINPTNQIFSAELNSLQANLFSTELISETEFNQELQELNLDLNQHIYPNFNSNILFAIHEDQNQIYPALTLISTPTSIETAKPLIETISSIIKSNLQTEPNSYDPFKFSYQTKTESDTDWHILTLTPNTDEQDIIKHQQQLTIELRFGIQNNRYLIFTTHKSPNQIFSPTASYQTFTQSDQITGVSLINFSNLTNYINSFKTNIINITGNNSLEYSINEISNYLSPFKQLTTYSTTTQTAINSKAILEINRQQFFDLFNKLLERNLNYLFYPQTNLNELDYIDFEDDFPFSDTNYMTDYFFEINNLHNLGIIEGYPDNNGFFKPNFKPQNQINRAEFTKLLIKAKNKARNKIYEPNENPVFPDVDPNAWYGQPVRQAKIENLIQGYPDGTFKPSNNITRAEALEIVAKTLDINNVIIKNTLLDTKPEHWYYNSANKIYNHFTVHNYSYNLEKFFNNQSLNPHQPLTRNEAALLIYNTYLEQLNY